MPRPILAAIPSLIYKLSKGRYVVLVCICLVWLMVGVTAQSSSSLATLILNDEPQPAMHSV